MAIYHCSIKIGSRAKGQSAISASAYRSGDFLVDAETGLMSDYTRKSGIVFSEITLCENAPSEYSNRETLWNAVHSIEKTKNAQLWREFEVALPKELSRAEQIATVREFVGKLTQQGMCIDWSLHDKGDGNPHAHIMATMRSIEPTGKWAPKSRKVYALDENGERIFQKVDKSGRKQYKNHKEDYNDWNAKERVEEWRSAWASCCNARLAERERIDHRSYERQGSELIPTIHEGYIARKLVKDGKKSDRVQINEDIRQKNNQLKQINLERKIIEIEKIPKIEKRLEDARKVKEELYYIDVTPKQLEILENSGISVNKKVTSHNGITNCKEIIVAIDIDDKRKALELIAASQPKSEPTPTPAKKMLSDVEIVNIVDLKNQYVHQYCANEYLKSTSDVSHKAKDDYDKANKTLDMYRETIKKYRETEELIRKTINPIKKRTMKKELAEQGNTAYRHAGLICGCFNMTTAYNGQRLTTDNITTDHLYGIYEKARGILPQLKELAETEKRQNEVYENLKLRKISDKTVASAYQKFVSALDTVPDEQAERVLKAVKEPVRYISFDTSTSHSEHHITALKNVEKALSKLYEVVKRIKEALTQPLFSKKAVMSDDFKPRSEREHNDSNYHSRGRGGMAL